MVFLTKPFIKCTIYLSRSMFQYKIIHNILATKVSLFRAKICDNNVCPQCLIDTHSLDHMFLHCPSAIAFWYANKTKQSLKLSNSMILYGFFDNIEHRYAFRLCHLNCQILNILQLPKRRKTLFWQLSHTSTRKTEHSKRNSYRK